MTPTLMSSNDRPLWHAPNGTSQPPAEPVMHALKDLFTTDVGLMSMGGIAFMLGMGVFFLRYFLRHMHDDEARAAAEAQR